LPLFVLGFWKADCVDLKADGAFFRGGGRSFSKFGLGVREVGVLRPWGDLRPGACRGRGRFLGPGRRGFRSGGGRGGGWVSETAFRRAISAGGGCCSYARYGDGGAGRRGAGVSEARPFVGGRAGGFIGLWAVTAPAAALDGLFVRLDGSLASSAQAPCLAAQIAWLFGIVEPGRAGHSPQPRAGAQLAERGAQGA
jgi:hypothetical protein